jgi:hypothetical protein
MRRRNVAGFVSLAALAAACGGSPDTNMSGTEIQHAGGHSESSSEPVAGASKTQDVTVLTLIAAAAAAYKTYTEIQGFINTLSGKPTQTDQILSELGQLQTQITTINSELKTIATQIAALYPAIQQASIISTQQNIADQLALANSAIEQANEWVQTGKTGPQIGFALNDSLNAMNALSNSAYWYRLGLNSGDAPIFDPRMALNAYLAALTARVGVLAIYQPNYRSVAEYRSEFQTQLNWLNQLASLMSNNVTCDSFQSQTWSNGSFWTCSNCKDTVSNYMSINDNAADNAYTPLCTNANFYGSQSDAQTVFNYYNFYDRWQVLDAMGQHVVQSFAAGVQQDTIEVIPIHLASLLVGGPVVGGGFAGSGGASLNPPAGWANPAPMVNQGLCLNGQMQLSGCSGAADQTWNTAAWGSSGATGEISSAGATTYTANTPANGACVDAWGWDPENTGLDYTVTQPCAGSPGEQWAFQQDGHVAWQRDARYCLAASNSSPPSAVVELCANSPNQIWSRTAPIFIPVPIHIPIHVHPAL